MPAEPDRSVVVLAPERYRPPPPRQEEPPPPDATVAVPDPTPHEEEPARVEAPDEIRIDELDDWIDLASATPPGPPAPAVVEETGPLRVGGEVTAPRAIDTPRPTYPELARRIRKTGIVVLEALIDEQGRVREVTVLKDPGFGLGEAAVQAVEKWRYEPATLQGEPVAVLFNLTVRWELY